MPSLDAFSTHGAFNMRTLTDSINKLPYVPGRIASLGLFDERGITTSGIMVEERDGVLALVPTTPPLSLSEHQRGRDPESPRLRLREQSLGARSIRAESDGRHGAVD